MFLAGFIAWTAAIGLTVTDNAASVGVAFTTAGMLLIAAAALYGRLRSFGPHGLTVDPIKEAIGMVVDRLPSPDPLVPPERERAYLVTALDGLIAELGDELGAGGTFSAREIEVPVDKAVQTYETSVNLEAGARKRLNENGFKIEPAASWSGGFDPGIDFYARRDDVMRPVVIVPRSTRPYDFGRYGRASILGPFGQDSDVSPIVVTDSERGSRLWDQLDAEGVGMIQIDPASGEVQAVSDPEIDSQAQ
jgi:hypothetical protein